MYAIVVVTYIFILYIQPNVFIFYTCRILLRLYMYRCDGPHGPSILNKLNHYTVRKHAIITLNGNHFKRERVNKTHQDMQCKQSNLLV